MVMGCSDANSGICVWGGDFSTRVLTYNISTVALRPLHSLRNCCCEQYAGIRARDSLSPPDASHLACAAQAGVDLFLTNDKGLVGRVIPGNSIHCRARLKHPLRRSSAPPSLPLSPSLPATRHLPH